MVLLINYIQVNACIYNISSFCFPVTKVKQKKSKFNLTTTDSTDVVRSLSSEANTDTLKTSIPSKPKNKHATKSHQTKNKTKKLTVEKQTVSNSVAQNVIDGEQTVSKSVSQDVTDSSVPSVSNTDGANTDISQEDPLLAASISSIEDKRAKLRAKIAELQGETI